MKQEASASNKLSLSTKVFYGIGDTGNAIVNSAVQFFLLFFYTDTAGVSPSIAAGALMVGKIWDAVNDPIIGWISDRVRSPMGKRRILMICGAVPLAVATLLLWVVPKGLSPIMQFVWITSTFILWDTLWSLTNVPYYALTAELTDDYDERSSLTTVRMMFGVPAYMIGAAATPLIIGMFNNQTLGYTVLGGFYGLVSAAALLLCAVKIRERDDKEQVQKSAEKRDVFTEYKKVFNNKPFVQLIVLYCICNMAFSLVKTMFTYLITYQFGMEKHLVMFAMLLSVALFLFPWKLLSGYLDKGPSYALGIAIGAVSVGALFFLPMEASTGVFILAVIAGMGFSANWVFPWAMVPDVIEYDQLRYGQKSTGIYYGVWGFAYKLTEGFGIVVAGWALEIFNYVPNVAQSPYTLRGIKLFTGPIPAALFLIALPLLIWYPVTRKKHQELCDQIHNKENQKPSPEEEMEMALVS